MTDQSLNPFNGKLVKSFDTLGDAALETKIATAEACFETWRHKPFSGLMSVTMVGAMKRGRLVHRIAGPERTQRSPELYAERAKIIAKAA